MPKCWGDRSGDRRRLAPIALAALGAAVGVPPASGLRNTPRLPPASGDAGPPALGRFTYPNDLIGRLEQEMADLLAAERNATPLEQVTARASFNVRVIGADLLGHGEDAGATGARGVLSGVTLAEGRDELDRTLARLVGLGRRIEAAQGRVDDDTAQRFRRALAAVKQFNDDAERLAGSVRFERDPDLDRALPALLEALGDAVSLLDGVEPSPHWARRDQVRLDGGHRSGDPSGAAPPSLRPVRSLEDLERHLPAGALRDDTRRELAEILDFLRRGEQFPRLRGQVRAYGRLMSQVLDLAETAGGAVWLDGPARERYLDRLHLGVMLFKDRNTRERGQRHLDRLETSRRMIEQISTLAAADGRLVGPLAAAFLAVDDRIDNPAEAELGERQLLHLLRIVERMIEYRELPDVTLRRELRLVYRQIDQQYRDAEAALLEQLGRIVSEPGALADPALASVLVDHRHRLADLRRVGKVPVWVDAIKLIDARAAQHFYTQARKMCRWLLDVNRRPDAFRAMDQFEQQLALFYPLPFETQLEAGTLLAVRATGGQHEAYVGVIEAQRRAWAGAWGDGDAASEAANFMLLMYRLNQTMLDAASVIELDGNSGALDRWAAWQLDDASTARAVEGLPSRIALAVRRAVEKDPDGLRSLLEQIDRDRPLARLIGRLSQALAGVLVELPDGAVGTVGQLMFAPPAASWLLHRRDELALICRYALEEHHARTTNQAERADELAAYVNERAERLLRILGDRREPLPTLIGFDGSDPRPG